MSQDLFDRISLALFEQIKALKREKELGIETISSVAHQRYDQLMDSMIKDAEKLHQDFLCEMQEVAEYCQAREVNERR